MGFAECTDTILNWTEQKRRFFQYSTNIIDYAFKVWMKVLKPDFFKGGLGSQEKKCVREVVFEFNFNVIFVYNAPKKTDCSKKKKSFK